jgi:two-component system sensor histidine kinase RstB
VALVAGISIGSPLVRRIRALEATTRAIASGTLGARADVHGTDEIAELARHFNTMAARVEWHARAQETMLQAIAHEYRTPLTTARFALALAEEAEDAADRAVQATRLRGALDELETLADEVETYARRSGDATFVPTRISDVITRAVAGLSARVRVEVAIDRCEGSLVHGDERLLKRLVRNLVENACRHAHAQVRVLARSDSDSVSILVEDDGPGLPEADRARVFEPFVQLGAPRTEGGRGLGLAIVARIAELHGGVAEARAGELSGACFVVSLPRCTDDQAARASDLR